MIYRNPSGHQDETMIRVELVPAWQIPIYPHQTAYEWYYQVLEWCKTAFGSFQYDPELMNRYVLYSEQDLTMFMLRWGQYVVKVSEPTSYEIQSTYTKV